jgi:hypothetical protein
MGTLTPKISIQKPTPNVETDWGFRWNENADILDDAVLAANIADAGSVTVIDDGVGGITVSGSPHSLVTVTVIDLPSDDENVTIMRTTSAITLQSLYAVVAGGGAPTVSWTVKHDTQRNAGGTAVVSAGTTTTDKAEGDVITVMDNPVIAANKWVWLQTTVTGGSPQELTVELFA